MGNGGHKPETISQFSIDPSYPFRERAGNYEAQAQLDSYLVQPVAREPAATDEATQNVARFEPSRSEPRRGC
jgi:hypothetical protein